MTRTLIFIAIILLFLVLQGFLSTRKNKLYGLIIPIILFITSTLTVLFMADTGSSIFLQALYVYSPVIINLAIYFICRAIYKSNNNDKNKKEYDKMVVTDL